MNASRLASVGVPLAERVVEACVLGVIAVLAFTGNVSLWCIICREKGLRSTSNALILCLSSADILVSAVNMPVAVATLAYGYWPLSSNACQVLGFITMLTFVTSVMSLGVISINRYILICRPHKFRTVYTTKGTALMICGTWMFSALLATPPLVGWGVYDYLPGQSFCFCQWKSSISYTFFMVGVCFGGPCSVMTMCYVGILRHVRASRRRIENVAIPSPSTSCESRDSSAKPKVTLSRIQVQPQAAMASESSTNKRNNSLQVPGNTLDTVRQQKREKKRQEDLHLTKSFLVVILVFIISWLPFCVTMFWSVFSSSPIPRIPDMATLLLGCANSSCNPIIYGLMNTRFRAGFKKLYCGWLARRGANVQVADLSIYVTTV